ncbi:MAG: glycosyltransferase family 4 protein [bacterium]|nr:glycosyltransferase family 4 protein [bacterium]
MQRMPAQMSYVTLARLPTGRAHGYTIMKMCEQFAAQGCEVELFVPTRDAGILTSDPFEYYGIKRNFSLNKLWATDLLSRFEKSRLSFFLDQISFLLSISLKRFNDTVTYTRDYQIALVARSSHIVLEIHNIPERAYLFYKALSRAKRLVVISEGLKRSLIENGVAPEKIVVAPDAVDLSEFALAPSREIWRAYQVDPENKIALYTGHFYGWKGAETLAAAAPYMPSNTELVLMGGVDHELKTFQKKYASNRVHVIGYQPRQQIPAFLVSADVLVLPNSAKPKISSEYTSPLKLFQYMASGVPIVASDLPSIREILTDEMAFWCTPDDERALARQIEYVLSHPDEARQKAARAREEVKKYTWDARAQTILEHIS